MNALAERKQAKQAKPGRPRSEQADTAIIDAALELFGERGVEGFCVEAVAAKAGVGKATIYRRWPNKEDLLLAALGSVKSPLPEPRGESVTDDLVAMLEVMARDANDPRYVRQFAMLHGEAERYPRLMQRYKEAVIEPRRERVRQVLRHGIGTGELRADLDVEIAMLAVSGVVMARGKMNDKLLEPGFATRVVDELLRGFAATEPSK